MAESHFLISTCLQYTVIPFLMGGSAHVQNTAEFRFHSPPLPLSPFALHGFSYMKNEKYKHRVKYKITRSWRCSETFLWVYLLRELPFLENTKPFSALDLIFFPVFSFFWHIALKDIVHELISSEAILQEATPRFQKGQEVGHGPV